jgi:hypothetical protein
MKIEIDESELTQLIEQVIGSRVAGWSQLRLKRLGSDSAGGYEVRFELATMIAYALKNRGGSY